MVKKLNLEGKVDLILQTVVTMGEEVREIKETMATKDYVNNKVESLRQDLTREVRAIGKAVDKDAIIIIDHTRQIGRINKHLALK